MKPKILSYGRKMLGIDLLLITIWAFFTWHFCYGRFLVPAMIFMRIAISFELFNKIRWAFTSAICFALAYIGCAFNMPSSDFVTEPIQRMVYLAGCLFLNSDEVVHAFRPYPSDSIQILLWIVWGLWSLWLVVMPIVCSVRFKSIIPLYRHRPRILWYIGAIIGISIYAWTEDKDYTIFIFATLMSLAPFVYRLIYRKGKTGILQALLSNKPFMLYISIVSVFLFAEQTGLYGIYVVKPWAAFLLPIVLYVIISSSFSNKNIKTTPAILYGIASLCVVLTFIRPHEWVMILLACGLVCMAIASVICFRRFHSLIAVLSMAVASSFVIPVFLMGYNPYAALSVERTTPFRIWSQTYDRGIYQISSDEKIGLRDRYGVVVKPVYDRIHYLDRGQYFVALYKTNGSKKVKDHEVAVFDLINRQFLVSPDLNISRIEEIRDNTFALFSPQNEQKYTLNLPSYTPDCYDIDHVLIDCKISSTPPDLEAEGVSVITSPDKKVKIYSWDTGLGGTSPDFNSYIQYETGDSIRGDYIGAFSSSKYLCASDVAKDGYEVYDGSFIQSLYQIDSHSSSPLYIISAYFRASSIEGSQTAIAFRIENGKLVKQDFTDDDGKRVSSISCDYYIPDWYFTTDGLGWDWVMSFDDKTKTLYVPERGDMVMTDRYECFRFDGGEMKHIGTKAGYWLQPLLHDYKRLCGIYQTDSKLIRVDQLNDGTYRMATWSKSEAMSGQPEMIISKGKTGIIKNAIVFTNGDYTYTVPEFRQGQGEDFGKVIIKHKDKIIQETEV